MEILDFYGIDCTGKNAAVIGRSLVVGRPAAMMLMHKNPTETNCPTNTLEKPTKTPHADNLNDISMFEIADTAIAVDNALPAAKEAADAVIGLNTTDAVARSMAAIYRGSAD